MKKISIHETSQIMPDYNKASKEDIVLNWLLEMRNYVLVNKIANFGDLIPSKKEISEFLNISTGTVQNAIKIAEDLGFFSSRQCIGTKITDPNDKLSEIKMFSKKDKALVEIKKLLFESNFGENEIIPNIIEIASEINTSQNTTRLALKTLIEDGILRREYKNKKVVLVLNSPIILSEKEKTGSREVKNRNLSKILKEDIKKYLSQNFKQGDKIPTNLEFAKMFNVSIRTINLAIKELNKDKIILSRRGKYGSVYLNEGIMNNKSEKSMFMSKPKAGGKLEKNYDYLWKKAFENIKKYILKNHEAGDKIPSIKELAKRMNMSHSSIRRAVLELSKQDILYTQKGKYGGIFVVEMPQKEDMYQWVAINPNYFEK